MRPERSYTSRPVYLLGILGLSLALVAGVAIAGTDNAPYGILGQPAPELNLGNWIDGDGNQREILRLENLRGKVVYLYFFQAWCPGCQSHGFPTLKALTEKFDSNPDVAFVAVQTVFEGHFVNTPDKLRASQIKYGIRVPMAHDAGGSVSGRIPETMRSYRSGGTPWTVIIDPDGTVVYNQFHIQVEQATALIQKLLERSLNPS